ncbi:MAG: S49 family peptidase, partial [Deltaproteobacteria bacterium]|nr:S49 family peptidase [Deltaproteobacteria bacterium]
MEDQTKDPGPGPEATGPDPRQDRPNGAAGPDLDREIAGPASAPERGPAGPAPVSGLGPAGPYREPAGLKSAAPFREPAGLKSAAPLREPAGSEPTRNLKGPEPVPGQKAADPKAPNGALGPVRSPGGRSLPPPAAPKPPRSPWRLEGWPLAFLILCLAVVGSCHYSVLNMTDSISQGVSLAKHLTPESSVAVVSVEGEIVSSIWADTALKRYDDDQNVIAVVLRLDTPGGAVAPCQEIVETIRAMSKPVVVSMGSVAASGGLYLAMAGDHVMANPGTLTGSIGVIMFAFQVSEAMEKLGVKGEAITSGQFKDIGSPFRAMREEERAIIQKA